MASLVPPVILKATARHTATMIFLHGLGDTGLGWSGALNTIKPPFMKIICPTAPVIPVTLNGGMQMPAWYDILSLDPEDSKREDMEGVNIASKNLAGMIEAESLSAKIPKSRIVIGGFSQGGAVALHTMLSEKEKLGACVALSTYVPGGKVPDGSAPTCSTPVFQVHGKADEVIPFSRGEHSYQILKKVVQDIEFRSFDDLGHDASLEEVNMLKAFLDKHVPEEY